MKNRQHISILGWENPWKHFGTWAEIWKTQVTSQIKKGEDGVPGKNNGTC